MVNGYTGGAVRGAWVGLIPINTGTTGRAHAHEINVCVYAPEWIICVSGSSPMCNYYYYYYLVTSIKTVVSILVIYVHFA